MRNKTWKYLVVTSAIFVLSACGGGTKKQVNEDVSMDSVNGVCDGLKTLQLDEVKVTWIQDNAKERLMERTLFADADDSLIESLKLQGGIPSSMSAFLVETGGIRILFDTAAERGETDHGDLSLYGKDCRTQQREIHHISVCLSQW